MATTARPVSAPAAPTYRRASRLSHLRGFRSDRASPLLAVVAWIVALIAFFPVFYVVVTGFKNEAAALTLPPKFIPTITHPGKNAWLLFRPTLEGYHAITSVSFGSFFRNSIIASLGSTAIVMLLAIPAAYGLAIRPTKKWRDVLFFFISTKFMPPAGIIVPIFLIYRDIHLLNTMQGLLIIYTAMNLPIAIWMLRSFFEEVPKEVLDAARVDGAGVIRELVQILLPMVGPGIVATIFISIIFAWNEFFFALNLGTVTSATVPLFMVKFVTSEGLFWAKLAAASTMAITPIVLLGWISQRQLVRGLSMGAVK